MKEADLSMPATRWLEAQGYTVYAEVPYFGTCLDLVGWDGGEGVVTVSLKLCLSRHVIHQANIASLSAAEAWCGVASRPRQDGLQRCNHLGLGIVRVAEAPEVLLEPRTPVTPARWKPAVERIIARLEHLEPGGVGGHPNRLGLGAAQEVYRAVQAYRRLDPKATFREMYEDIPNHYASANSMCGAMRKVEERRAWKLRKQQERGG